MSSVTASPSRRVRELLALCFSSVEAGGFRELESLVTELVNCLNSLYENVVLNASDELENDVIEVLDEILKVLSSPQVDQDVIDALSFHLPKVTSKFADLSSRCLQLVEEIVDRFVEACNPRDMLSILCEALDAARCSHSPSTCSTPLLHGLSKGLQQGEKELHKQGSNNMRLVISLAAAFSLVGIILVCSLLYWFCHRRRNLKSSGCGCSEITFSRFLNGFSRSKTLDKRTTKQGIVSLIDYNILEKGTSGFKESNILGQGGFGCVYLATLENNISAAVKKLDCANEEAAKEFKSEVEILSKLQHPNIISLLGYSTNDTARFIVYELMPNVSLESHLHGSSRGSAITWPMRMKIALDVTRGLEYLHEHCHPAIIHRDLKSSNILLDSNFNAKISDFGLAVVDGPKNKNHKLSGTVGYVAPEYLLNGQLTEKSDVYAFGVVLLELLLGKKPVEKLAPGECQSIITWAMPYLTDRTKLPSVIDPAIKDTMDLKHLYQVAAVAVLCVQPEPSYRPLITDVLQSLIPLVPMELGGTLKTIKYASMDHC